MYDSLESSVAVMVLVDGIYNELFKVAEKYPEISQSIDSSLFNLYSAEQEILDEFTSVLNSGVQKKTLLQT